MMAIVNNVLSIYFFFEQGQHNEKFVLNYLLYLFEDKRNTVVLI